MKAPLSDDEPRRLAALRRYAILDSEPEPAFDRLSRLLARMLDVPIAFVSFADADRSWIKASVGLAAPEIARNQTFCTHAIASGEPLIVPDALEDPRFREHAMVVGEPRIRFYAGVPLRTPSDFVIGTLCALDTRPRELEPQHLAALQDLGAIAIDELELRVANSDIEELLSRTEESLRTQLRILHGVLESAGDGIVVADEQGELTVFNPAAERLLGAGAARPRPSDWSHTFGLLTADGNTHFAADQLPMTRALAGESSDNVEMLVRNARVPSGVYVTVTGRPLLEGDKVRGGVVTFTDVTKLKVAQSELARLASLDGLTGVPNHRAFKERLAQLTAEAERGRKFTLVLCDLDHFKVLNDTFGHPVGDDVLVAVAQALRSHARATDLVARYGGEEFAVLYTDVGESIACKLVERLMRALDGISSPVPVTASFGICEYTPSFKGDSLAMLAVADQALYRAKHEGRNRFVRAHSAAMH